MKLFSVGNTKGFGLYIAAPSDDVAIEVASKVGHIKEPVSARVRVEDVTESASSSKHMGMADILAGNVVGVVTLLGVSVSWDEIMRGERAPPSRWCIREVEL